MWMVNATYLTAFAQSLRHFGHLEALRAGLEDPTRRLLDDPSAQRWWPGPDFAQVLVAYEALHGRAVVSCTNVHTSGSRMGPLVKPLASVLLAFTRTPAAALLAHLPTFLEPGVQNVRSSFACNPKGGGGHVRFLFPEPVPEVLSTVWHGLFDTGFALAKQGRVVKEVLEPAIHHYDIEW
ncbi:MAG: hypothetical protein IT380_29460 [Myxococcales bacterium]|nr:hypothetical protein [Myxococcales bacterium]